MASTEIQGIWRSKIFKSYNIIYVSRWQQSVAYQKVNHKSPKFNEKLFIENFQSHLPRPGLLSSIVSFHCCVFTTWPGSVASIKSWNDPWPLLGYFEASDHISNEINSLLSVTRVKHLKRKKRKKKNILHSQVILFLDVLLSSTNNEMKETNERNKPCLFFNIYIFKLKI